PQQPVGNFSPLDVILASCGLPLFLFDIVLDIWAAVEFYKDGKYWCLAVLLLLLIGSSVLAQLFSWLWYSYDNFNLNTTVEKGVEPCLGVLHYVQLGIYVRHFAVVETAVKSWNGGSEPKDLAVSLNHDLSMLRIIETFSESAPQIFLMISELPPVSLSSSVLKTIASLLAVAYCVTMYHRCMRSFLPEKKKQSIISSVVYFVWNLLLLWPRIVALALFASVLPCFIVAHFLCSWLVLFFCAWRAKTDFMDSTGGEQLFRATLGLIWYFDWFNVGAGKTRKWTIAYHTYILADISLLCGLWFWRMSVDPPHSQISCFTASIIYGVVVLVYAVGLVCKVVYYLYFHPNVERKEDLKGEEDELDSIVAQENGGFRSVVPQGHCNKRMQKLAQSFYVKPAAGVGA
uniref:XK-related protein n=1 Tax=Cyprinodon variegatus TaxID=28743 RepID=A0A3Q2CDR5_CYPVA